MAELTLDERVNAILDEMRKQFIVEWLPLAWRGCRRFMRCDILLDDLRQEAVVGLIRAVDAYDPAKGPFLPYASKTINYQLRAMCADQMRPCRITYHVNALIVKVRKAISALNRRGIWNPSDLLISEQSGLMLKQVVTALSVDWQWHRVPSGDFPMPEPEEVEPIDVRELLAPLDPNQQNFLIQRYGLDGQPRRLLKDIAKSEGVTKECIRKRQAKALAAARQGVAGR